MGTTLAESLKARPVAPARTPKRDTEFTNKLEVSGNEATIEIRGEVGQVDESTARALLKRKGENPDHWEATGFRSSEWTMPNGGTGESNRYVFKRVASDTSLRLPDLDDLHKAVKRIRRKAAPVTTGRDTVVGVIADPQVGKVSERGGVDALLERLENSRENWTAYIKEQRPSEIFLVDAGDAIENFENTGSQERTNDLQLTEQLRVWRRIYWSWIETAASLAPKVKVVSVPSNHCRVRRGKANMATPDDDYGIEVLAQVSDIASAHPEKYGHVSFYSPDKEHESVALQAAGGKVLGFAHGHQVGSPDKLGTWMAGQALGRTAMGDADIAVFGHWHNLRVQTVGDDRWIFIAPTSDNGSAWFRNISGNESAPGVLTFVVDEGGWRNLHVC